VRPGLETTTRVVVAQAYVDCGHDVTTVEQAYEALTSKPLANTVVSLVDFDLPRLKQLEGVFARCPVNGSSQIRHAVFTEDGVLVRRHAGVSEPVLIPQAYITRATVGLETRTPTGTLTGASCVGQLKPEAVALSRAWKTDPTLHEKAPAPAAAAPLAIVSLRSLGHELYKCTACDKVACSMETFQRHACAVAARTDQTVLGRACAMAFQQAAHVAPPAFVVMTPAVDQEAVPQFQPGWARPVARDHEVLDERTTLQLRQWFAAGEASAKTKCSAPTAIQRLKNLTDIDGSPLYDEEELPSESRVRRFFGSLTSQRKKANQAQAAAAVSGTGSSSAVGSK